MRRIALQLSILASLLLAGCAAAPKEPLALAPGFHSLGIRQVAVAPVIFRDEPIDRYYATRVAGEISAQAQKKLTEKGYAAVRTGEEEVIFPFRDEPVGPFPLPAGADALLTITIDHFLDAGIYDRVVAHTLDIYATAVLTTPGGEVVWKDEGVGRGPRTSLPGQLDWVVAPAYLADSLFATLPPSL